MKNAMIFRISVVLSALLVQPMASSAQSAVQTSIVNSPHNLSTSGPGAIRASSEQEVCIFCHAPHNASPVQPLWNRSSPVNAYTVYSSSSLQAKPGQPTGSSKLCLSCHDGTIAVGSVLSRGQQIAMAGGITTLPPGHGNLGTDLSDDHPISFRYDATLTTQDPKIKPPSQLPESVKVDRNQEMQCTSCHDAHNNAYGKFLVMDNTNSNLCNACHQISNTTTIAAHTACASCHQMHSAPSGPKLLTGTDASQACLVCHSSEPAPQRGQNIGQDLTKISRHLQPQAGLPLNTGAMSAASVAVDCASCHEPHTMQSGSATAPQISPRLGRVSGVNNSGAEVSIAQFEYEVCFKCHANTNATSFGFKPVTRQIVQPNTRLQFASSSISFHPVEAPGRNADMPSLRTGAYTTASLIYCTDCHASDSTNPTTPGTRPGPHGSNITPLLTAGYDTTDGASESPLAYALCYKCHDRTSILADESFSDHKKHIVEERTPCSVCHDAHGISSAQGTTVNNSRLINFDTSVVQPDPVTGRLEYRTLGPRFGECYLTCHGEAHSPRRYPEDAEAVIGAAVKPPTGAAAAPTMQPLRRSRPAPSPAKPIRPGGAK